MMATANGKGFACLFIPLIALLLLSPIVAFVPEACLSSLPRRQRRLYKTRSSSSSSSAASSSSGNNIRFLGRGSHAIVRPGVVLIAPQHEYHHFYRKAAIFIHAMGQTDDDDDDDEYVIRGLIVDHPTPFTLQEMMMSSQSSPLQTSPLGQQLLWRGGDRGGDGVVLLHSREELGQSPIGMSGLYQGGWEAAMEAATVENADDFKAFFNYCEFTEAELENMLQSDEDGDAWASVEVDPSFVLNPDWDRGDAWARLRNHVAQILDSNREK